jgi:uncharacterized damage-inducible protein DinB
VSATAPTAATAAALVALTPDALRHHWQGHRRLSRRVLELFPDDQLFTFAVGGMRPYGVLALEMLSMAEPMVRGAATGEWTTSWDRDPRPKAELLAQWDASTAAIDTLWAQIPAERFQETLTAFGQYTGPLHELLLYCIDNEIHHRGQGYVYLRALGIEPPPFWER